MINNTDIIKYGLIAVLCSIVVFIIYYNYFLNTTEHIKCKTNKETSPSKKDTSTSEIELVLYKQNGCPHCVDFLPIWNDIQKKLNKMDVQTRTVECSENPKECANIQYIPTIKFKQGMKEIEFEGNRTKKDVIEFFNKCKNSN